VCDEEPDGWSAIHKEAAKPCCKTHRISYTSQLKESTYSNFGNISTSRSPCSIQMIGALLNGNTSVLSGGKFDKKIFDV